MGSKIPWLGLHEKAAVSGNLLILLLPGRIGPKRFKAVIDGLMRSAMPSSSRRTVALLMAENIKENAGQLGRFKRAERGRTGPSRSSAVRKFPSPCWSSASISNDD